MDENQTPPDNARVEKEVDEFYASFGIARRPPYSGKALEAAIPSWGSIGLTVVGVVAIGLIGHRATRKMIVGDKTSYERYERHTPDCHEVYERFEQSTIFVQRG